MTHGHYSTYKHGCRCADCRAANTEFHRQLRHRKMAAVIADPDIASHGKSSTYTNCGCRCTPCREAHTAKRRAQRLARRRVS